MGAGREPSRLLTLPTTSCGSDILRADMKPTNKIVTGAIALAVAVVVTVTVMVK